MKKIWKMKKSKEAVSPVIATILMVAITVVLAAVLYVMVMGFGSSPESNPSASMLAETTSTAHTEKVTIADISESQTYANMKVSMVISTGTYVSPMAAGSIDATLAGTPALGAYWNVTFVDIASDGKVSAGDYFLVQSDSAYTGTVTMNLLYGSDAKSIATADWNAF